MGNSLGSMFSGYLQAAAYRNLNGVHGLAGWRWLFVIDGIITLRELSSILVLRVMLKHSAIAFIGFALFPGLPNSGKRWFMSQEEYELASDRLITRDGKKGEDSGITWRTFKQTLSKPMWWICVTTYMCVQPAPLPAAS